MPDPRTGHASSEVTVQGALGPRSKALRACVLASSVAFYFLVAIVGPLTQPWATDLAINYSAAVLLRTGSASIYDRGALRAVHEERIGTAIPSKDLYKDLFTTYINPPTTALMLVPLSLLPFWWARVVFLLFNNVLYLVAVHLITRMLDAPWKTREGFFVWIGALTFFPFTLVSNWLGQMDGFILFLLTLSLWFTFRRRDVSAGVCVALASVAKLTPILVLGFFLARRRWSALGGALVTTLVIAAAVVFVTGPATTLQFTSTFLPLLSRGSALFENQSLLGALYHFTAAPAALMSLDTMSDIPLARMVWACLTIALTIVVVRLAYRARLDQAPVLAISFGAFVLMSVLGGAISWDHYMTWLVIPIAAVLIDWSRTRWLAAPLFWPAFALTMTSIAFPFSVVVLLVPNVGRGLMSCGTYGMLMLLLLVYARMRKVPA